MELIGVMSDSPCYHLSGVYLQDKTSASGHRPTYTMPYNTSTDYHLYHSNGMWVVSKHLRGNTQTAEATVTSNAPRPDRVLTNDTGAWDYTAHDGSQLPIGRMVQFRCKKSNLKKNYASKWAKMGEMFGKSMKKRTADAAKAQEASAAEATETKEASVAEPKGANKASVAEAKGAKKASVAEPKAEAEKGLLRKKATAESAEAKAAKKASAAEADLAAAKDAAKWRKTATALGVTHQTAPHTKAHNIIRHRHATHITHGGLDAGDLEN